MRLPDPRALRAHAVTGLLIGFLVAVYAVVAGACAEVVSPLAPCEYALRPLTDSTSVVGYKTLPCWDANVWRVVRAK